MAELQKLTQSFFSFFFFKTELDCKSVEFLFHLEVNKLFRYLPSCIWADTEPAVLPHWSPPLAALLLTAAVVDA